MSSAQVPVASPQSGRLSVCPTPIGNLADVTLRTLEVLRQADTIACEDTRRTRVLLDRYEIVGKPVLSFHEHNEAGRAAQLVQRIRGGAHVALVSDAGTPLVSDPGHALVRACLEAGLPVQALPGANAPLTALVLSGLPAERFRFVGFLPRKTAELARVVDECPDTIVAFESPRRLPRTLAALAGRAPERRAAVCRELTKVHEEVRRGSLAELAADYAGEDPRGEIVLVLGPAGVRVDRERAMSVVRELVDAGARPRAAANAVAALTGASANELYRALTAKPREGERQ